MDVGGEGAGGRAVAVAGMKSTRFLEERLFFPTSFALFLRRKFLLHSFYDLNSWPSMLVDNGIRGVVHFSEIGFVVSEASRHGPLTNRAWSARVCFPLLGMSQCPSVVRPSALSLASLLFSSSYCLIACPPFRVPSASSRSAFMIIVPSFYRRRTHRPFCA